MEPTHVCKRTPLTLCAVCVCVHVAPDRDRLMIGCEFWSVLNPWLLIPLRSVWATALALVSGRDYRTKSNGEYIYIVGLPSVALLCRKVTNLVFECWRTVQANKQASQGFSRF